MIEQASQNLPQGEDLITAGRTLGGTDTVQGAAMKATVTPINQRIGLQLNVAIAFEALILNRLLRLPKTRRQEWLRGLLVQGFRSECRALRKLQRDEQASANGLPQKQNASAHRSVSAVSHQAPIPKQKTTLQAKRAASDTHRFDNRVSFAALRKVIG